MTACGDCGLEPPECKCGPRWIREAFDVMMSGPGVGEPEVGRLAKALIERLPLQAITGEVVAALAGESGACDDEAPLLEWADRIVQAVVSALTEDAEVVTLTELYQGASRALDAAGVPYAVDHHDDMFEQLDLPARIRWLADQRPTRIDMEREVSTVKAERDNARERAKHWRNVADQRLEHIAEGCDLIKKLQAALKDAGDL